MQGYGNNQQVTQDCATINSVCMTSNSKVFPLLATVYDRGNLFTGLHTQLFEEAGYTWFECIAVAQNSDYSYAMWCSLLFRAISFFFLLKDDTISTWELHEVQQLTAQTVATCFMGQVVKPASQRGEGWWGAGWLPWQALNSLAQSFIFLKYSVGQSFACVLPDSFHWAKIWFSPPLWLVHVWP